MKRTVMGGGYGIIGTMHNKLRILRVCPAAFMYIENHPLYRILAEFVRN